MRIAAASLGAVARRIRNHPSVIGFLIGSDNAPPARLETPYLDALRAADWPNPVLAAAAARTSPQLGPSGVKMDGPYDYVPPNYWYGTRAGAASGFAGELSAGPNIPSLDALNAMLSPAERDALWRDPAAAQYHAGLNQFQTLNLFSTALRNRYGPATSLGDYVTKAPLAGYENIRAQFEAYAARMDATTGPKSTGLVYWMLNNGWPSLIWHLYHHDLVPDAGLFAATEANRPLHVLWQYDDGAVKLVNHTAAAVSGLSVTAETYRPDGTRLATQTVSGRSVGSLRTAAVATVPAAPAGTGAYLVKLVLKDAAGAELDRNVYWWSTRQDVLNWDATTWYTTPQTQFADLSALTAMPRAEVTGTAVTSGGTTTVTLTRSGAGSAPAFFVQATLRGADGAALPSVAWSDNAVSVWPGETVTLTATHAPGQVPVVEVAGVNVARRRL